MKMYKEKKEKKPMMSDNEKTAKMSVLEELKKQASDAMGGKLKGLKKVSVMASDKEGLKEGLEKAEELVEEAPESMAKSEDTEEEKTDDYKHKMMEDDSDFMEDYEKHITEEEKNLSYEDLEAKIKALEHLKHEKYS